MSLELPVDPTEIERIVTDPDGRARMFRPQGMADVVCQAGLAAALCHDVPALWRAVKDMSPPSADAVDKRSAIAAALVRVVTPGSWPALRGDHFEAARGAESQPFGFFALVIEEAAKIVEEGRGDDVHPGREITLLTLTLQGLHPNEPALTAICQRHLAYEASHHLGRGETEPGRDCYAEADQPGEPPDVVTRLRLLELKARFTVPLRPAVATRHYKEAFNLSLEGSAVRSFEILAEAVARHRADPESALNRLSNALNKALSDAGSTSSHVVRAHLLCHSGWHVARLMRVILDRWDASPERPLPNLTFVVELADKLESTGTLVHAVGDEVTQGFWLLALGRLRQHHTPSRAAELLLRAVATLSTTDAVALAQDACDALAEAMGERPPSPAKPSGGSSGSGTSPSIIPPDVEPVN